MTELRERDKELTRAELKKINREWLAVEQRERIEKWQKKVDAFFLPKANAIPQVEFGKTLLGGPLKTTAKTGPGFFEVLFTAIWELFSGLVKIVFIFVFGLLGAVLIPRFLIKSGIMEQILASWR